MSLTLLHDALILTLNTKSTVIDGGYVLIRDHNIVEVRAGRYEGAEIPDRRIDAATGWCPRPCQRARIAVDTMAGFGDQLSPPSCG